MMGFAHRPRYGNADKRTRRLLVEPLEERQLLSNVFTVTNTLDDGSAGSLRWAITQVNGDASDSTASADRIEFNIPQSDPGYSGGAWTIAPTSALPAVTNSVVIDGYTQSGATPNSNGPGLADNAVLNVILNGAQAPAGTNGLQLAAAGVTVRGLVVNGFAFGGTTPTGGEGIAVEGSGGDTIAGNFIGTNAAGSVPVANGDAGIQIAGAGGNTIGGTTPGTMNLIAGNANQGIRIEGQGNSANLVAGNFVGLDATGTTAVRNNPPVISDVGILIDGSVNNTIGGASESARNVVSGNGDGIEIRNQASGNLVEGNYVGPDVTGTAKVALDALSPNSPLLQEGVTIVTNASANTIGGTTAGTGNLISGNMSDLGIGAGASHNVVDGNLFGTDPTGLHALTSQGGGIMLYGDSANTIGGSISAAHNVIAAGGIALQANAQINSTDDVIEGNLIGLDITGETALPIDTGISLLGATGTTIGGVNARAGNVIAASIGVAFTGGAGPDSDNVVAGNLIGTDVTGKFAFGNSGILFSSSGSGPNDEITNNTIGGTTVGARNVIANGVGLLGVGVTGNTVEGNFLGTDVTGTLALGQAEGVALEQGATANTIGGTTVATRNVISGNSYSGVLISGADGNVVEGNLIGTDATGTHALSNGARANAPGSDRAGLSIYNASDNTIGGTVAGAGNVVSGNTAGGIVIFGTGESPTGAAHNLIVGNLVGTDASGRMPLGNSLAGISVTGIPGDTYAQYNTIGGTSLAARNVISGNYAYGIVLGSDSGVANTAIMGNAIGTDVSGTIALGNGADGVQIAVDDGNTIGGTAAGAGNIIANNGGYGVQILANSAVGNAILGNSIFANDRIGIDLFSADSNAYGVDPNAPGGPHVGPNDLQNFPVLDNPVIANGQTIMRGTLNSTPNIPFTIEFFSNATYDQSGYGQGQTFLGRLTNVYTDGAGNASFSFVYNGDLTGQYISATATDWNQNTSEFSADVPLQAGSPQLSTQTDTGTSSADGITRDNGSADAPLVFTVAGVAPPFGFVQLYNDTNPASPIPLGAMTPAENGTATITLDSTDTTLTDGTYKIAAAAAFQNNGTVGTLSTPTTVTVQSSLRVTAISPGTDFVASLTNNQIVVTFNHWLAGLVPDRPDGSGFASAPFAVTLTPSGPDGLATYERTHVYWSAPASHDGGDLSVPATAVYQQNADGTSTITLTPDQPLATDIYLIAITGLTDLAGNPLSDANGNVGSVYSSFDYRPSPINSTAPNVTAVTADNGAVVIGNDRIPQPDTIGIRFSKPMDTYTINTSTVQLFEKGVAGALPAAVAYSPTTQSAYLTPETMLVPGAVYYVSVSAAVTDDQGFPASGVPLGKPFATSFTVSGIGVGTGASPLTVLRTDPANGTAWTSPLGYGAVTFSEPIALSSLGRFSAMLIPQTGGVTTGGSGYADVPFNAKLAFNPNTNQLIIVPTGLLPNDVVDLFALHAITATNGDALAGTVYSTFLLNSTNSAHPAVKDQSTITEVAAPVGPRLDGCRRHLAPIDAAGPADARERLPGRTQPSTAPGLASGALAGQSAHRYEKGEHGLENARTSRNGPQLGRAPVRKRAFAQRSES